MNTIYVEGHRNLISLNRLLGIRVVDAWGHVDDEACADPVFRVTKLVLENGELLDIDDEPGIACLGMAGYVNLGPDVLGDLLRAENESEELL